MSNLENKDVPGQGTVVKVGEKLYLVISHFIYNERVNRCIAVRVRSGSGVYPFSFNVKMPSGFLECVYSDEVSVLDGKKLEIIGKVDDVDVKRAVLLLKRIID